MSLIIKVGDVVFVEYNPRTGQRAWAIVEEIERPNPDYSRDPVRYGLILYSPADSSLHALHIFRGKSSLEMMYEAHVCGEDKRKVVSWHGINPHYRQWAS